MAIEMDI